ncbi:MAG: hypothetical protein R2822_12270 [Spirosomataceae bacterium]
MKRQSLFSFFAIILIMMGCTQEKISIEKQNTSLSSPETIEVIQGRLKFSNHEVF